jgi:hypothetical protein
VPKFEEIPAGAESPADLTEDDLVKAVEKAQKEVDRFRKIRVKVREEMPKAGVLKALAETEDDFQAAIDRLNQAEHDLGRFRGAGEGQRVSVGTAKEVGAAGGGN